MTKSSHRQYTYSLSVLCALLLSGCPSTPIPKWMGKIYAGNSKEAEITRKQGDEHIKASDPKFDKFACMTYVDLESFYQTYILGCKVWKGGAEMIRPQDQMLNSSPFVEKK